MDKQIHEHRVRIVTQDIVRAAADDDTRLARRDGTDDLRLRLKDLHRERLIVGNDTAARHKRIQEAARALLFMRLDEARGKAARFRRFIDELRIVALDAQRRRQLAAELPAAAAIFSPDGNDKIGHDMISSCFHFTVTTALIRHWSKRCRIAAASARVAFPCGRR